MTESKDQKPEKEEQKTQNISYISPPLSTSKNILSFAFDTLLKITINMLASSMFFNYFENTPTEDDFFARNTPPQTESWEFKLSILILSIMIGKFHAEKNFASLERRQYKRSIQTTQQNTPITEEIKEAKKAKEAKQTQNHDITPTSQPTASSLASLNSQLKDAKQIYEKTNVAAQLLVHRINSLLATTDGEIFTTAMTLNQQYTTSMLQKESCDKLESKLHKKITQKKELPSKELAELNSTADKFDKEINTLSMQITGLEKKYVTHQISLLKKPCELQLETLRGKDPIEHKGKQSEWSKKLVSSKEDCIFNKLRKVIPRLQDFPKEKNAAEKIQSELLKMIPTLEKFNSSLSAPKPDMTLEEVASIKQQFSTLHGETESLINKVNSIISNNPRRNTQRFNHSKTADSKKESTTPAATDTLASRFVSTNK